MRQEGAPKGLVFMQGRLEARWLDESDCVGAWQSGSLAAVVLPTAESLDALREIDADRGGQRLMLVFNPQWQTDGQIVSDFGCVLLPCLHNRPRFGVEWLQQSGVHGEVFSRLFFQALH